MAELTVGNRRKFTFSENDFTIHEILENPGITMKWTWTSGLCPHCKKRIERTFNHSFNRIEILVNSAITDNIKRDDIIIMGDTVDGKRLILSTDKYDEVLKMTSKFKYLVGGVTNGN